MSTPSLDAWSAAQENRDFFADLTAEQIRDMPFSEFARLTGRATPTRAALDAVANQAEPDAEPRSSAPMGDSLPSNSVAPQAGPGPSQDITDEQFLQWRAQRGNQGEGRGMFDSVSSQSDAYRDAVARQSGRTAFGREQHHPGIPRQFRKDEIPPSGRRQFYSGS